MLRGVSELCVFLASPSDLEDERAAIRALETSLNITYASADIRVRVVGWEDLPPGYGRPQGQINPLVDECHIFVGLLRRRWGSETGEHETGFMEEFDRAVERRHAGGSDLEISLFFAELAKAETDDAGPGLTKVLAFRTRVETERIAIYSTFSSADDLARKVESLVTRHVLKLVVERNKSRVDGANDNAAGSISPPPDLTRQGSEDAADEAGGTDPATGLHSAGLQIKATTDALIELLAGRSPHPPLDHDRLELVGIAFGRDNNTLGSHLVNRLYHKRDDLDITVAEHGAWITTLMDDIGTSRDLKTRVVPGWAILRPDHDDTANDLIRMAKREGSVGQGALRSMHRLKMRPKELWPSMLRPQNAIEDDAPSSQDLTLEWTKLLNAHPGRSAALNYLMSDLDSTDEPALKAIMELLEVISAEENLNPTTRRALEAARAAIVGNPEELADSLGYSSEDTAEWRLVLREPQRLSERLINQFARQSLNRSAKIVAVETGLEADTLSDQTLKSLLFAGDDLEVTELLIASCEGRPDRVVKYLEVIKDKDKSKSAPPAGLEARLIAAVTPVDELQQMSSRANLSVVPWEALTYVSPEAMLEEARDVLRTDAAALRDRLEPELRGDHVSLIDFLADDQRRAAASLIARHGQPTPEDIGLVLKWFTSEAESGYLRDGVWKALLDIADATPASQIEAALKPHIEVVGFRRGLDHLDGPLGPALAAALVDNDEDTFAEPIAAWRAGQPERAEEELIQDLYSRYPSARIAAAEQLIARLDRDRLLELLEDYPNSGGQYWYNVVALFDEFLYAPTPVDVDEPVVE